MTTHSPSSGATSTDSAAKKDDKRTLRIATGGIHTESCTFSPLVSNAEDFVIRRGEEILQRCPFATNFANVSLIPLVHARALPGGPVERSFYEAIKDEFLSGLMAEGAVDGVYFDIHGAMNVQGLDDAEADFAEAIRECIGESVLIAASMDLHGNVSERLAATVDIFTAYRTAPHLDVEETRAKAFGLLVKCLREGLVPVRAWVRVPVILPGERTSTIAEPGKTFYKDLESIDSIPGVLDASFWVGYVWGGRTALCRDRPGNGD